MGPFVGKARLILKPLIERLNIFLSQIPTSTEPDIERLPLILCSRAGCSLAEFRWFCRLLPENDCTCRPGGTTPCNIRKWDLRSRTPRYIVPPQSSGADPDELKERARERRLVIKSGLNRDVDQQYAGLAHRGRGAFTGAVNSYAGRFSIADRGTLFLDEICDMPLQV